MNYRGVNPERMSKLLEHALTDDELKSFFQSSQKRLIIAGEHKIQRLPGNREEAIKAIIRFGEKAHGIFAEWLRKESEERPTDLVNQLAPRFLAIEECGVEFDEDEMHKLARCGLDNLYSDAPAVEWLRFLATDPVQDSPSEPTDSESPSKGPEKTFGFSESTLETFVGWARGGSPPGASDDPRIALLTRLEDAARSGSVDAEVIAELPPEFTRLRELLQTPRLVAPIAAPKRGVQASAPSLRSLDPDVDYASLQVVATRVSRHPGTTFFLDVEGFIDQRDVFTLSDEELRVALPEEGKVILFPDVGITPTTNRPMSYEIERFDNQRPIKVRVTSRGRPLYEVIYVPHSSDEHDLVRDWILQTAKKGRALNPVFITNDGLCLKPRVEPLARVEGADFDWLLDSWSSIAAVEFRHGTFVLGPIAPSSTRYDCAPVAVSARRLFRTLAERKAIKVTREQVAAIVEYLRDEEGDELKSAHQSRILGKLINLSKREEEYDQLVAELMKSTSVVEDIEARKQAAVADAKSGVQREQKQLQELRRQRQALEEQLGKVKAELDERIADMRKALKRAFETARSKEAETLAGLALWQVLSGNKSGNVTEASAEISTVAAPVSERAPPCKVSELSSAAEHASDVFSSLGLPEELSTRYAAAMQMAAALGLPLIFTGAGASAVGLRAAASLRREGGLWIDVPIGLISEGQLADCLVAKNPGILLLRNANLSDMSLYAPTLLDQLTTRVLDPPSVMRPVVVLTAASGPAALPWPGEIEQLAVKFDLSRTLDGHAEEPEPKSEPVSPLKRKAWLRIQRAGEESEAAQATAALVLNLMRDQAS